MQAQVPQETEWVLNFRGITNTAPILRILDDLFHPFITFSLPFTNILEEISYSIYSKVSYIFNIFVKNSPIYIYTIIVSLISIFS